jgi:hypothetical protein
MNTKTHLAFIEYNNYDIVVKYSYFENETFAPFGDIDIENIEVENIEMGELLAKHVIDSITEQVIELHRDKYCEC